MSASINVGMCSDRTSSRVLKPPGGGHSQIFGFDSNESATQKRVQTTEISSCFTSQECKTKTETQTVTTEATVTQQDSVVEESEKNDSITNGSTVEEIKSAEIKDDKKEDAELPPRKRVPPGGFSSGFW